MKTPMQQLQEKITALINDSKGDETRTGDYRIGLHQALSLIDLEAEKEQIIDASVQANLRYDSGANEPVVLRYCNDAEQYYNQLYD